MSGITTHVLDTARGLPASGVPVTLSFQFKSDWQELSKTVTNNDGRAPNLMPKNGKLAAGIYRITFDTAVYYHSINVNGFYPSVTVMFEIVNPDQHHHVPLLLSPFGYSTYRGS
ncbi:MAG TPA: hydroxyisourate hydrolase [Oculatellaceae cyanobacterium]